MSNGSVGRLFAGLGKALINGLVSSKPPDEGCNVCPEDKQQNARRRIRRPGVRRVPAQNAWRKT